MSDRLSGTSIDQLKTMKMKDGAMISAMSMDDGMGGGLAGQGQEQGSSPYANIDGAFGGGSNEGNSRGGNMMGQRQNHSPATQQQMPPLELMNQYNQAKNREVEDLARDLNESLEDLNRRDRPPKNINEQEYERQHERQQEEEENEQKEMLHNKKKKNKSQSTTYMDKIPKILQEPLIILILYVILSQSFVKNKIGEYIKQINPGPDGQVSLVGIIIYGLILAILFAIFKWLLIR